MTPRLALLPTLLGLLLLAGCQTTGTRPSAPTTSIPGAEVPAGTVAPPAGEPAAAASSDDAVPDLVLPDEGNLLEDSRGAVVFARLRRGLLPGACDAGDASANWRRRYAPSPRAFAGHIEEILPLLDFVSREVETQGLPAEFALIPIVESWYRPNAIGAGGPAGMWQMIASTARNHGIRIQNGYDGRLSPVESTRAALSYLKTLQGMFDGWQPTLMAYNAGEGRILNAFKRNGSRQASGAKRLPKGLSHITYAYIDKVNALSCLFQEPERSKLDLPDNARFAPLAPILVDTNLRSLDQVARRYGASAETLRRLNPGYKGGKLIAGVPRLVLMPATDAAAPHVTTSGEDTLADADDTPTAAPAGDDAPAPDGATRTHRVGEGESVWTIAKRYGVSVAQVLRLNNLGRKAVLRPGQVLKLTP